MTLLTTRTAYTTQTDLWVLSISIKKSSLLENCNRYRGTYISISSELHALFFLRRLHNASCVVFFCSLLRFSSVFCSSIMPPRPSKRRNRPVSFDPKSLTFAELNALPRNSLWHEDAFSPPCLRTRTCERPPNTGHWPSPPSSDDVKRES